MKNYETYSTSSSSEGGRAKILLLVLMIIFAVLVNTACKTNSSSTDKNPQDARISRCDAG